MGWTRKERPNHQKNHNVDILSCTKVEKTEKIKPHKYKIKEVSARLVGSNLTSREPQPYGTMQKHWLLDENVDGYVSHRIRLKIESGAEKKGQRRTLVTATVG